MSDIPAQPLDAAQAMRLYPSLKSLALLCDAGWRFLPIEGDEDTAVLEGFKRWPDGWRDCIRIREENDALGLRIRMSADRHTRPVIVWEHSGSLADVVHRLMGLPTPGMRLAPALAIGTAPTLWTP